MTQHKKYKSYKRQRIMIYNHPQPEVLTCQGGGEMFKTGSLDVQRCSQLVRTTRNSPADVYYRDLTPFEEKQLRTNHPQIYKFIKRFG